MLRSLLFEYGPAWVANRALYVAKIKSLQLCPSFEKVFEKNASIVRLDLFDRVLDFDGESAFLMALPKEEKAAIVEKADKATCGVISAFSSVELDYGQPIDWFRNPQTGYAIDATLPWFRIPDFSEDAGDIKVYWEISRFTHFFLFARAVLLTHDVKYYEAFSSQLHSWVANNKYGFGPNYKCGQEASLRMLSVLMAYSVFKYLGMVTEMDEANVSAVVEGSYRKVLSNFFYARKCIRNNHTLSEACGMLVGAWCCEDENRFNQAIAYYEEAISFQFREDGGYVQWSFNYQRFALQITEVVLLVLKNCGRNLSEACLGRIQKSVHLLYQMQDECTGELPNYGSNDGALVFPVSQCTFRDYTPTIHALFCLIEGLSPFDGVGLFEEEAVWFGTNVSKRAEIERRSSAFYEAGLFSLRLGDVFVMTVLQDFRHNRPGNCDQLHLDVWHAGKNVFCDSGTYSYASEVGQQLASVRGHNTVYVPGLGQMDTKPPFLTYNWPSRKFVKLMVRAGFDGSYTTSSGYVHRRMISVIDDGALFIEDILGGLTDDGFEVMFRTQGNVTLEGNTAIISFDDVPVVVLVFSSEGLCGIACSEGEISPKYLRLDSCRIVKAKYAPGTKHASTLMVFEFDTKTN